MAIKNSFNLFLILLIQEITHIGIIKAVSRINKIDMPSMPNLNLIKPLIQTDSSTNWKFDEVLSKEYHKNKTRKKFAKLVNKET